jgi:hypothetical protein|nr:MAG TPA: hypothetical protein [Caudoviricetes sp.]
MSFNNALVSSFLKTDADLLFVLKTKAMRKLVEHTSPLDKYAFIERVVDGLPAAAIVSDMDVYNMQGDQGLRVCIVYTPKRGNGDIRGRNNLEETPRDLFNPSNPRKEVGYKLLSYFLAIRETIQALNKAFKEIKESGCKVSKRDKYARKVLSHLGWFVYLSISEVAITDKERQAIERYLNGLNGDIEDQLNTEAGSLLGGIIDISTLASELTETMVGEHMYLIHISMFKEDGLPFITVRNADIEMDLDNVSDEYQAKMDNFIKHYREYLSVHGDKDAEDKIKRVVCGLRLAYGVVKTLRYPSPDQCEVVKQYRETLTKWSILAKQIYSSVSQF